MRFVLGAAHAGKRLDRVVTDLCEGVSRGTVQRWIAESRVMVSGRPGRPRDSTREGDVIEVDPGPVQGSEAEADASVKLTVLHEDPHLIVIDKPAGLVVHPARGHRSGTLVNGLLARPGFQRLASDPRDPDGNLRPGIVHRLDKDTSGVLVVAKDEATREGLKSQLSARTMERQYVALTVGVPAEGAIDTLYGRHPSQRVKFSSLVVRGRSAVTHVAVTQVLAGGRAALVACSLETGRTHQIRVHLAEQTRTPVLADALYGAVYRDPLLLAATAAVGRHALHARTLGFQHPVTGQTLRFEAALPPDFERALAALS